MKALSASLVCASAGLAVCLSGRPVQAVTAVPEFNAETLAQSLIGGGFSLVPGSATLIFSSLNGGGSAGFYNDPTNVLAGPSGFTEGVILSTGNVSDVAGPNTSSSTSTGFGTPGDPDLDSLVFPNSTNDATSLSFQVQAGPTASQLTFAYSFWSEEYNEFVDSSFNDVFALTVNGTNLALAPGTNDFISINNVNNNLNSAFFRDNEDGSLDIEYDGGTTVLFATTQGSSVSIVPGGTYDINFSIADTSDDVFDSSVFLVGESIATEPVPGPLPVLGAAAAFGYSRKLRKKLQTRTLHGERSV